MEDFQIIQPSTLLIPYVKQYWLLKTTVASSTTIRTVPTGHINLIFHRGKRIFSEAQKDFQPRAFLCGHEKTYADLVYAGRIDMISIVFRPIGAKVFFDLPMSETNGLQIDINDLNDPQLADLGKSIEDAGNDQECILLIERFLLKRITCLAEHNLRRIDAALQLINTGRTDVMALAETSCLSYKQFNRIFNEYIGAKPKEYLRTIRFQKALYLLQSQPDISLTQLAFDCGYYDQPHLIKEFKFFSGYTPLEYLAVCAPFSDYFS